MGTEHGSGSRALAFLGLLMILLLLVSCGAVGVATQALPGCEGCHFDSPRFKSATLGTSHGRVPCVGCHVQTNRILPRAKFGVYEAFGMWLRILNPSSSDVTTVIDGRCLSCHREVNAKTVNVRGLRIKHSACAQGRRCVDCHSEVGHGRATTWPRVASMNDCVDCHKRTKESLVCATCHTGKVETLNFSKPEFAVTHGPNWKQTHGMGQMSVCSVCHGEGTCSGCHGPGVPHSSNFIEDHPQYSSRSDAKCTSCHRKAFCLGCHQVEMPHPKEFASTHSRLVKEEGEQMCLRCHAKTDCDDCHVKHVHPGGAVGPISSPGKGGN